ncbi:uncharacterized protein EDB93DRAFT_1084299 [Suillus bovinus]|uniref:uncharacterized protein n=1 Tax=Suillus bovinus TaxID=48563 RepID=UPI001B85FEF4|nr:uncharacterized protein EDB93DRAFT_1084299 [Suillus bovinus]KAG2150280.1 hypothetical protein EDB93DRAFT_1084299 [Suillus bovinus]
MDQCHFPTTCTNTAPSYTVQTSTFYPPIRTQNTEDVSLQPLCIGICFSGDLPRHLVRGVVPIQISVSIAEEYRPYMTPVMEALTLDRYPYSECSSTFDDVSGQLSHALDSSEKGHELSYNNVDVNIPIPFLLLPSKFNPMDSFHWLQLSEKIQHWLVTIPAVSQHWTWGHNAFWLAFVGACPDFPCSQWPMWDPRIPLEGQFIEHWLDADNLGGDQIGENLLDHIWTEFCAHAMLFHPDPLVSVGSE